jgi:predicted ester cyclase
MADENRTISEQNVQRVAQAFNAHSPEQLLGELADRFTYEDNFLHEPIRDKNQYREYLSGWMTAFPDAKVSAEHIVVGQNKAALISKLEATHKGDFKTPEGKRIGATNKRVKDVGAIHLVYDDQGRITEMRVFQNPVGFLKQLGVDPKVLE